MDFNALKSNLKNDFSSRTKVRLALISDSASQFLVIAIRGYGYSLGYNFEIHEISLHQADMDLQDTASELYQFSPEFVLLFHSPRKKLAAFYALSDADKNTFAEGEIAQLQKHYNSIISKLPACKIVCTSLPECGESVFGNYSNKVSISYEYQSRKYNYELMNISRALGNLYINDIGRLQGQHGTRVFFDPRLYVTADMAYSLDALPLIAKNTCDIIHALSGHFKKCLILDLDNTLWGGVIGDDGIENIQIGSLGIGKAFSEFQAWVRQLRQRGIILVVCSQNNEEIAKKPFIEHPEMVLRLEDISLFVANWDSKTENIKYIQSVLNIDFNSMVFVDDDIFQRNLVRTYLPEVTVPELPEDPGEYISFLTHLNYFEAANFSHEDSARNQYYQQEISRTESRKAFSSEADYMRSLGMQAEVLSFDSYTLPRIAQLIQRSNQFNLTTIRYTEEQLRELNQKDKVIPMAFTLKDRFGNHGVISVVILRLEASSCTIDSWIMSCRVLRRGMENLVLDCIVKTAERRGCTTLCGEYIPTAKNGLVENHYQKMDFTFSGGKWKLGIDQYVEKPFCIEIIKQEPYERLNAASN